MPYHNWEDSDFDWKALHGAGALISRLSVWVGLKVWWKEKYGTLRYEFICMWGWSNNRLIAKLQKLGFQAALFIACLRYEQVAPEILDDWATNWDTGTKHYIPLPFKLFLSENPWKHSNEQ